jgi:hypothetical protein
MLEQILRYLHNWFVVPDGGHYGDYQIEDGSIDLPFLVDGQYYRICGSVFNDGLHRYGDHDLTDEAFAGCIWALAIPHNIVTLADEMTTWESKNAAGIFQSESFGGYTYTLATGANGGAVTVFDHFADKLAPYKKMRENGFKGAN